MPGIKASINFGLVNIPVEVVSAEDPKETTSFHMLDAKDNARIRYKRVNENTGKEVEWSDIAKGVEVEKEKYVVFTSEELKALEEESNRNLQIEVFVDKESVSPIYFESPYFLAPAKGGEKAYVLLEKVLSKQGKYAVVQAVLRNKQHLGVIFPVEHTLVLGLIRYADEVKDASDVLPATVAKTKITEKEIVMAERLVDDMTGKFDPKLYSDTYEEKLQAAIQQKLKGKKSIKSKEPKPSGSRKSVDIMDLLKKSLRAKAQKAPSKRRRAA